MPGKCSFPGCKIPVPEHKRWCVPHGAIYDETPKPEREKKPIPTMSAKKKAAMPKERARKKDLSKFFDDALNAAPFHCQECSADLRDSVLINPRTIVAHILKKDPKYGFPSVACNHNNKVYLCYSCHHKFDNKGEEYIVKMKIYPELVYLVGYLIPELPPIELARVPHYYLQRIK